MAGPRNGDLNRMGDLVSQVVHGGSREQADDRPRTAVRDGQKIGKARMRLAAGTTRSQGFPMRANRA
jgi:hypothetical protein